jgi:magnesium-transporting ATPase (P-type)
VGVTPFCYPPSVSNDDKILSVAKSGLSEIERRGVSSPKDTTNFRAKIGVLHCTSFWRSFREPMFTFLVGGGFIYLLLGDLKEALILLAFAILSVAITVIQETRTERVLEALRAKGHLSRVSAFLWLLLLRNRFANAAHEIVHFL